MENYAKLEIEIIEFESADIITNSSNIDGDITDD